MIFNLTQRIRAFILHMLALGHVASSKFITGRVAASTRVVHHYHVTPLVSAATTTALQVTEDITSIIGVTDKLDYLKNKIGKLSEGAAAVQKRASTAVTQVKSVGHSLATKAVSLPGVSWGVSCISSWASSGLSFVNSLTESTVNEYETQLTRVRLEDETSNVQFALRHTCTQQVHQTSASTGSSHETPTA